MAEIIEYTADDEEPKCGECDNVQMPDKWCVENCGANNGWNGYRRTEIVKE